MKMTFQIRRSHIFILISVVAGIGLAFSVLYMKNNTPGKLLTNTVVPQSIIKTARFNVYYPEPSRLPTGYTLDHQSFSATDQAIVYAVSYANGLKIAFTVQRKPSRDDIERFHKAQLPLYTTIETPHGDALLGNISGQTVVSLATSTNSWLLITAPADVNQEHLKQIVQSIKK